ncbi:hypothetical protein SISSUDRAFT_1001390 [Sistotremastrum suecicum HHB10207 ss-3]|uniref:Protein kinase domain-containing protein n=1 Tax=Sistotremastrum suecicum HHB10207 ss-3 TaxID=1314776 RepID=A0A166FWK9_9AGAM|nr:hypothetical protein SISSUDRAFT_1001390 [Sistotremastrum suecicum HHB10207 ss-3]
MGPATNIDDTPYIPDVSGLRELTRSEKRWASYHGWLRSLGYELRQRYQPDWSPSWLKTKYRTGESEDSIRQQIRGKIMDAKKKDGTLVAMKLVPTSTKEIVIWRYLSSPELRKDTRNHCVPLFDVHPLPDTDDEVLAVMPLLLYYDALPFETPGEVMRCVYTFLEGLAFMHDHNVAHLDIDVVNSMMDPGSALFPRGFHPANSIYYVPNPSSPKIRLAPPYTCRTLASVKFYYVDFGESVQFPSFEAREQISGAVGHSLDVPEFKSESSYDPFMLDVRTLGDMLKAFPDSYQGLECLNPLIEAMRQDEPTDRPTSSEALAMLRSIITKQNVDYLSSFLRQKVKTMTIYPHEYQSHQLDIRILRRPPIYPEISGIHFDPLPPPGRFSTVWQRFVLVFAKIFG